MNYKVFILCSVLGGVPFFGISQNSIREAIDKYNSNTVEYISVEELAALIEGNKEVKLLDAREAPEYEISHLQDAIFVGYGNFEMTSIQDKIQPQDTLVVYCSIGVRSEQIGEKLKKEGYVNVYNLYGGMFEWFNKGYKIYDRRNDSTQKIHAYDRFWGKFLEHGQKVY
ncbi:rhodanese-like domain-containing protein [Psychroflexus sp. MES1-P1E]|uniref:rhodanese-like domain-containing protein n=1 Tax=Psychroflexus sp. MES1-P1E TaxID=2058320 RepID=UPI000C7966DF|nr:rhodanese-like domain-containing protein [Psychroflexus sp. MES1-P1E]PKG41198.1 rhodanese-like domain-containing protein [Psychroflexus sp. MES1-P1E]